MKYQILFSGKNKKKYIKMLSAENFIQSVKHEASVEKGYIYQES